MELSLTESFNRSKGQLLTSMDHSRESFRSFKDHDFNEDDAPDQLFDILRVRRGLGVSDPRDIISYNKKLR
jgi:hypothetical protein